MACCLVKVIDKIDIAFFDIDGTIHQGETIWEAIHKKNNSWGSHGKVFLEKYIKKEINFEEFACLDVEAWKGMPEELVNEAVYEMKFFPEVEDLLLQLKDKNAKTYIVSNSLSVVAKRLVEEFSLSGYVANDLVISNGKLTGELVIHIKHHEKGEFVKKILSNNLLKEISLAIGDGENDLPMLAEVDYPILYNPKGKIFANYDGFVASSWHEVMKYITLAD